MEKTYEKKVFLFSGIDLIDFDFAIDILNKNHYFRKIFEYYLTRYTNFCKTNIGGNLQLLNNWTYNAHIWFPVQIFMKIAIAQYLEEHNIKPISLIGSSLDEYACLFVSKSIDIETINKCIYMQTSLLYEKCTKGCMIKLKDISNAYGLNKILLRNSRMVSYTTNGDLLISSNFPDIVIKELKKMEIQYEVLPIEYALHSDWINSMIMEYNNYLNNSQIQLNNCNIPFYSCSYGSRVILPNKEYLSKILRLPIQMNNFFKNASNNYQYELLKIDLNILTDPLYI